MILVERNYSKAIFLHAMAAIFAVALVPACAQTQNPINRQKAEEAFREAQKISASDAGHLWGNVLYGPMLFVDPETRAVVANEPDAQGLLRPWGTLYAGRVPESVPIANAPTEWSRR